MSKSRLSNREKFFLFCLLLFFTALAFISASWNANSLFSNAYQPMVEKSRKLHSDETGKSGGSSSASDEDEEESSQPRAAGMREQDINKQEGKGYRTY